MERYRLGISAKLMAVMAAMKVGFEDGVKKVEPFLTASAAPGKNRVKTGPSSGRLYKARAYHRRMQFRAGVRKMVRLLGLKGESRVFNVHKLTTQERRATRKSFWR